LIQLYKRVGCATVGKITTNTMTTFLNDTPLDKREREKNDRDIVLLLLEGVLISRRRRDT
jgi:hypothetical protein